MKIMKRSVQQQLLDINQDFYNQFAPSFSATRDHAQPGAASLISRIDTGASVLDVGCGNGTFARALVRTGFIGKYLGVDMSARLLDEAIALTGEPLMGKFEFTEVNLAEPGWEEALPEQRFDWLMCFAVLHHLPGEDLRLQTVKTFKILVSSERLVAVSVWQWQNSPRLRKRVLPWSTVGLSALDLDEGDVLLDWRAEGTPGLRYVHTFSEAGLSRLAEDAGFTVQESFYSDGKSGDLALYQVWSL